MPVGVEGILPELGVPCQAFGVLECEGWLGGKERTLPTGEGQGLHHLFLPAQGVSNDTSSLETERGFEELPLCSCRMEAPKIDRISERAGHKCMATESVDGEVGLGCWLGSHGKR